MVGISRLKVQAINVSQGQEDQWGQLEACQEALAGAAHLLNWVWVGTEPAPLTSGVIVSSGGCLSDLQPHLSVPGWSHVPRGESCRYLEAYHGSLGFKTFSGVILEKPKQVD